MLLLAPIWSQNERFPTITAGLIALHILIFAASWPLELKKQSSVSQDRYQEASRELIEILLKPSSGLAERERAVANLEQRSDPFPSQKLKELFQQVQTNPQALFPEARYRWDLIYPLYESLERSYSQNPKATTPFHSFGFRKDGPWWPGLLTHQFLHAGFLHLFFNMLFLWVVGTVLEEILGLWIVGLYMACGVCAALAQVLWGIPSGETMVGASGAVSGLMAFALLAKPRAKIKLFYLVFLFVLPRYGVFDAPLWFFVPLWLFDQVLMALMTAKNTTVTVGYAAHLGGFLFGALSGWLWKK